MSVTVDPAADTATGGRPDPQGEAARRTPGHAAAARPSWAAAGAVALAVALATLSLSPLLEPGWYAWPLVLVLVLVGVGTLASYLRIPTYVIPLVQVLAAVPVLVAAVATDPVWGPLPTPASLERLQEVLRAGTVLISEQAPPVEVGPELLSLVLLGVGAVTVCTYVLGAVLRLPLLAGLPLLALYLTPAAVLTSGSPVWAFLLTAVGWLTILVVDARDSIVAWGRSATTPDPDRPPARRHWSSWAWTATRLGVVALAVAVLIPPLVPGVFAGTLGGSGAGNGPSDETEADIIALDPFVSLRRNLQQHSTVELFSYTTDGSSGAYLRAVVADSFDGEKWIPRTFDATQSGLLTETNPSPLGLSESIRTRSSHYELSSRRLSTPWLPLPSPVSAVKAPGDWRWDTDAEVAFSTTTTTARLDWQADSLEVLPTFEQLAAVPATSNDDPRHGPQTPAGAEVPEVLRKKAAELTAGISSPYEQALAIQWWLRDNFTYSTDVAGDPDADQLTQFLADRKGYCQQFAATMALMTRSLGITSRVAVGFTPGTQDASGTYHVTTQDAHAWPELYFSGIGWVRFEPTPRASVDGGDVQVPNWASQDDLNRLEQQREHPEEPTAAPTETTDPDQAAADAPDGSSGTSTMPLLVLAVLVVLGIVAALPSQVRGARRRRRLAADGRALAEGAWAELGDIVRDVGGDWPASRTPRQAIATLQTRHWATPETRAALERIGQVVEAARYAPSAEVDRTQLHDDLQVVRDASTAWLDGSTRLRIRAFPPTVFR